MAYVKISYDVITSDGAALLDVKHDPIVLWLFDDLWCIM